MVEVEEIYEESRFQPHPRPLAVKLSRRLGEVKTLEGDKHAGKGLSPANEADNHDISMRPSDDRSEAPSWKASQQGGKEGKNGQQSTRHCDLAPPRYQTFVGFSVSSQPRQLLALLPPFPPACIVTSIVYGYNTVWV